MARATADTNLLTAESVHWLYPGTAPAHHPGSALLAAGFRTVGGTNGQRPCTVQVPDGRARQPAHALPPRAHLRRVGGRGLRGLQQLAGDAKDRTIEVGAEKRLGTAVWQQMKQNAAASAGAILLGHLFTRLRDTGSGVVVQSTTLYAPACTTRFAVEHYGPAARDGLLRPRSVFMEILDDERERADSIGPYGKSLLYLVSRALESYHKTPLLGLDIARQREPTRDGSYWPENAREAIDEGNDFLRDHAQVVLHGRGQHPVDTGAEPVDLAHGSFDNDRKVITRTVERILDGEALVHAIDSLAGV